MLGAWLRGAELEVTAVYISNVPEYYRAHERDRLFDAIGRLPLREDAQILTTRRSRHDLYPRSYLFTDARTGFPWWIVLPGAVVMLAVIALLRRGARARRERAT